MFAGRKKQSMAPSEEREIHEFVTLLSMVPECDRWIIESGLREIGVRYGRMVFHKQPSFGIIGSATLNLPLAK